MTTLTATGQTARLVAEAELHGFVAITLLRADLHDAARADFEHGDRDDDAPFFENLGHADFLTEETDAHCWGAFDCCKTTLRSYVTRYRLPGAIRRNLWWGFRFGEFSGKPRILGLPAATVNHGSFRIVAPRNRSQPDCCSESRNQRPILDLSIVSVVGRLSSAERWAPSRNSLYALGDRSIRRLGCDSSCAPVADAATADVANCCAKAELRAAWVPLLACLAVPSRRSHCWTSQQWHPARTNWHLLRSSADLCFAPCGLASAQQKRTISARDRSRWSNSGRSNSQHIMCKGSRFRRRIFGSRRSIVVPARAGCFASIANRSKLSPRAT